MEAFVVALQSVWNDSGFSAFTMGNAIMMLVGIILLYLAIGKVLNLCCCLRLHSAVCWQTCLKQVLKTNRVLCR